MKTKIYTECRNCGKPIKLPKRSFCCYECMWAFCDKLKEERKVKKDKDEFV